MMDMFNKSGAVFSPCRRYRYRLWRTWDEKLPVATFIMLNPSTADDVENDPTVERCQRRAMQLGFGGLRVANLFAWRSTDPEALYSATTDPVGRLNDQAIYEQSKDAGIVICAWGTHGNHMGRGKQVLEMLRETGIQPHYLQLNRDGTPKHPLYVSYETQPTPYSMTDIAEHKT